MVEDRWVYAARRFTSIESSFQPYGIYSDCPSGVLRGVQNFINFSLEHSLLFLLVQKVLKMTQKRRSYNQKQSGTFLAHGVLSVYINRHFH